MLVSFKNFIDFNKDDIDRSIEATAPIAKYSCLLCIAAPFQHPAPVRNKLKLVTRHKYSISLLLSVSEMLLQLLLVLLTVRSPAVPALGVAIPFFSNSDDEAARDLPGDGKDNEEFSVTVKSEYHGNVPLILRQTENARTFESLAQNAEQALDNKVMEDAEGNSHFQIPLILLPTEEIKVMHEGEKPVIRKDLHNNNARQDDDNHGDRGESARIVNVQGQRRNPVYPGAGSRKSIKLNKPPAIRIQDSYEPFQYSNFPRFACETMLSLALNKSDFPVTSSSIKLSGLILTSRHILLLVLTGEEERSSAYFLRNVVTLQGCCLGWLKPF